MSLLNRVSQIKSPMQSEFYYAGIGSRDTPAVK